MTPLPEHYPSLGALQHWQLNAYALAMCERLFPHFALYHDLVTVPEGQKLRTVVDKLWDALMSQGKYNPETLMTRLESIEISTTDDSLGADLAMDALAIVVATLGCFEEASTDDAASCGMLVVACIHKFLIAQEIELADDISFDSYVLAQPVTQYELSWHGTMVADLEQQPSPNVGFLTKFKQQAQNSGISPIGVSL